MKELNIVVGSDGQPSMRHVYSQMTEKTAKLLLRRVTHMKTYMREYSNLNIDKFEKSHVYLSNKIVIRWGNRIPGLISGSCVTYNQANAIARATRKGLSRQIFIQEGVNTPKLYLPYLDNPVRPKIFPVIARPSSHSKGKDFIILNSLKEYLAHTKANEGSDQGWYYSEYIPKDREFRVYVAHGKVLGVNEKPKPEDENQLAWNQAINHDAWTLLKWADYPLDAVLQACKAVKVLGLDFGGVDVVLKGKTAYVIEVNTAPTLVDSPTVSFKFAKYFDWLARKEERREHWDFTKWNKAESFAWKEYQLLDKSNVE